MKINKEYIELKNLGFSKIESLYYSRKAHSFLGCLFNKDLKLYNTLNEKLPKQEKVRKIKRMFKESKTLSKLIKLKIPQEDIKNYTRESHSLFGNINKNDLEHALERPSSLKLTGIKAKKSIDNALIEFKKKCNKEYLRKFYPIHTTF